MTEDARSNQNQLQGTPIYAILVSNCEAYEDYRESIESIWSTPEKAMAELRRLGFVEDTRHMYPIVRPSNRVDTWYAQRLLDKYDVFGDGLRHHWVRYLDGDDVVHDEMRDAQIERMYLDRGMTPYKRLDDAQMAPSLAKTTVEERAVIGLTSLWKLYEYHDRQPEFVGYVDDGNGTTYVLYMPPSMDDESAIRTRHVMTTDERLQAMRVVVVSNKNDEWGDDIPYFAIDAADRLRELGVTDTHTEGITCKPPEFTIEIGKWATATYFGEWDDIDKIRFVTETTHRFESIDDGATAMHAYEYHSNATDETLFVEPDTFLVESTA